MFTLQRNAVEDNALDNAEEFVGFWSHVYGKDTTLILGTQDRIDYVAELNRGQDLTDENCRRLLRWKDPRFLTHAVQTGPKQGQANRRVEGVLRILPEINRFRREELSEEQFLPETKRVFPEGFVWRVFLFHIAQPHSYPIADRNVFRSFRWHRNEKKGEESWEFYQRYRVYFREIASACHIPLEPACVPRLKDIDNALWAFGQFLNRYYNE